MIPAFRPAPWLPGGHLQTIVPSLWPARALGGANESSVVDVGGGSAVRLDLHRPSGRPRGTILYVHGLGGSADSGYMRRSARQARDRGWIAVRMNLRNCGGTERLARTLYNAGQSDDADRVWRHLDAAGFPRPFAAVGFSLGGNLLLRYAGRAGDACAPDAVVGVNPPVRLERCMRALERPSNRIYQLYFTILLSRQVERIRRFREFAGPAASPLRIRTVRRFDSVYTAPDAGYPSAEAYYDDASASGYLRGVRRPALILTAADDPFVPVDTFEGLDVAPRTELAVAPTGGHVGYWGRERPRFWAGSAVLTWIEGVV